MLYSKFCWLRQTVQFLSIRFLLNVCFSLLISSRLLVSKCSEEVFIKKETLAPVFSVSFTKFLRTPFLKEQLRWLVLSFVINGELLPGNLHLLKGV